jgi:CelD/BcsL family acetyltransferase involved in cellulose biosynthesis
MRVVELPIDDSRWEEFTSSHPDATPFHMPAWASMIADCYRFHAFALVALDSDGEIVAGIPVITVRSPLGAVKWVSLPFSDHVPLLARADVDERTVFEAMAHHALAGPAKLLEVRAALGTSPDIHPVDAGFIHRLSLPSEPANLHPRKSHRESRNKAIRLGVNVTLGTEAEDMATFYRLHALTRRRHGVPVQPGRFFKLLQDRFLSRGNGFIATATLDGVPQAAGVYLSHGSTMVAKYHASDPGLPYTGAGHLLEWTAMVHACELGFRTLDVGRTDRGADGLRLYKSGWGATEYPLTYSMVSRTPPSTRRPTVGEWPKRIIRNSPVWVCRAAGEVLYRWTA